MLGDISKDDLIKQLQTGIGEGEIIPYYQPIVRSLNNKWQCTQGEATEFHNTLNNLYSF